MGHRASYSSIGMGRCKVRKMTDVVSLSAQQTKLYACLKSRGFNKDVPIVTLFEALGVQSQQQREYTEREMQQQVGSAASRTNKKIEELGYVIVPGDLKQTYRLTKIKP
jgi:hypothetical protein